MKRYCIFTTDGEGGSTCQFTNDLKKDFIDRFRITYDEDDDHLGSRPQFSNVSIGTKDQEVFIFKIDSSKQGFQNCIGQFNFFVESTDDVDDFIRENWREMLFPHDESIKKFEEFKLR